MNTEVYIENYRLDVSNDISSLLNFEIDNIRNFASRSTTWSKTIVLPGTANNNKLFGHIFQVGQTNAYDSSLPNVNYNFNASKSADCVIFQDQMQTFRGVIRLLQINIIKGRTEYEVAVFGKIAGLNVALSAGFLTDLDFSAYDQLYNESNVTSSWDNAPGTGVYFPLIDYGTYSAAKHDWDIRTFRPALYVREYIDKMMTAAGFRWQSDLFDTTRFKKLVVPHNQKTLMSRVSQVLASQMTSDHEVINTPLGNTSSVAPWDTFVAGGFSYAAGVFTYTDATTLSTTLNLRLDGKRFSTTPGTFNVYIRKNGVAIAVNTFNTFNFLTVWGWNISLALTLATGDTIDIFFQYGGTGTNQVVSVGLPLSNMSIISDIPTLLPVDYGQTITMNDAIPFNVRQIDFLTSIVKLFNLYVYEDRFDPSLIYFKPYVDFYSTTNTNADDWTYKLNRDKNIAIKPMSELNSRKYEFKYKPDSDYYNDLYRKRYNEGYGDYVYDSLFEFAENNNSLELIFSSTPLVGYVGEEKVYPTIFKRTGTDLAPVEERTDSNIRIMQTKKVTGVASWDILDDVTVLTSTTDYGYAGHFDDPDAPSNDLNFGALRELFFILATGDLTVTQFNVYWSAYMAEITDKDSKLMAAWFYLTTMDILSLDFSKYKWVDGVLFRLNKIGDYNASKPMDCLVELFKVGHTNYTDDGVIFPPVEDEGFLLWDDTDQIILWDTDKLKYA